MNGLRARLVEYRVPLCLWSCSAVGSGIYVAYGVWVRASTRAWERLPVWHWRMRFEVFVQP
jgi:hypothetical protein